MANTKKSASKKTKTEYPDYSKAPKGYKPYTAKAKITDPQKMKDYFSKKSR